MSESAPPPAGYDPRLALPDVDSPVLTETGVILMSLDADRLLAGLALAGPAEDPAEVALAVDRVRHGATAGVSLAALVDTGAGRWRGARAALDATGWAPPHSGSLRQSWTQTLALLDDVPALPAGPAVRAYLATCWIRRAAVDARAA